MAAVQKGLRKGGFCATPPNPGMKRVISNPHYKLAKYMGTGAPRERRPD